MKEKPMQIAIVIRTADKLHETPMGTKDVDLVPRVGEIVRWAPLMVKSNDWWNVHDFEVTDVEHVWFGLAPRVTVYLTPIALDSQRD
jgi:hypothetical protein